MTRKMMVIIRKEFDDSKQNFPYTVQTYSFCCASMENAFRIHSIYYSGSQKELLWDTNYDSSDMSVRNFEGVPIRHCPWCQAELVIIDQPNIIVVQSPIPKGHKKPRIKGGVGPNLFKLAANGSLAETKQD